MTNSQFIQDCCFYIDEVAMLLCCCVAYGVTFLPDARGNKLFYSVR